MQKSPIGLQDSAEFDINRSGVNPANGSFPESVQVRNVSGGYYSTSDKHPELSLLHFSLELYQLHLPVWNKVLRNPIHFYVATRPQ